MISKGNDYDSTSAFGQSEYKGLPKGGYICRILQAEEIKDKNGNPMVHIEFDIIDGEFTGHFMELFKSRKKANPTKEVKFPFEGQLWIGTQDYQDPSKTSRQFKGLCTALEDSGTEVWDARGNFLLGNLKNAEIGIVYQNKEQEYEGKRSWRAVPWGCRSVESIENGDYFIPDDKPLPEKKKSVGFEADSFEQLDESLPF